MRASTIITAASLAFTATLLATPVSAAPILGSAGAGPQNAGIPMENWGRYWDGNSWDSQGLTDGGAVNPCNIGSLAAGTPCGLNADAHATATLAGHPLLNYVLEHGELGFQAWTNPNGSADMNFGFEGNAGGFYDFAMLGEFTGDWDVNEIGWYELGNPQNRHTIFTADAAVGSAQQVFIPTNFGFYYLNTSGNGEMFFTQSMYNTLGATNQQFAAFQLRDYTILGVEDIFSNTRSGIARAGTSDYDYNDVIFGFRAASVPEPTTLLLLGMGLTGIALKSRRKLAAA